MQHREIVRAAVVADLPDICALGDQIQRRHVDAWPQLFAAVEANRERPFWRSWIETPDHIAFVATRGATTVGMITASLATQELSILCPLRVCHIAAVVVAASEQRTGVGRSLVAAVEKWAKDNGAADIRLHVYAFNSAATKFYEKLGYVVRSHTMGKLT